MTRKTIKVDYLARVEGEGALHVNVENGAVESVRLEIFEPPRFFEAFLRGRHFSETPDIVARICGICPVAYQMSAVHALENALELTVSDEVAALRTLMYCGEWIESHVLHIYMLHAPDFLGYEGAIEMAKDHRVRVEQGLAMKQAGNAILRAIGGREIHPINVRVGGFHKLPSRRELQALRPMLEAARDQAVDCVNWAASLDAPSLEHDYELVALCGAGEYPMNHGRIRSTRGIDIEPSDFDAVFEELHVPHSTALHAAVRERGAYLTGPLARYALNHASLHPEARRLADQIDLEHVVRNPFRSIIVRALEVLHAFQTALELIDGYRGEGPAALEPRVRAAVGHAATEAPRGLLYHRYAIDEAGLLTEARIVPPTSQNQPSIENDLRQLVGENIDLPDDRLRHLCEQSIRNHDPCISCSTHFLNLDIRRA